MRLTIHACFSATFHSQTVGKHISAELEHLKALLALADMSLANQKKILQELNDLLGDCIQDLFEMGIKFEDAGLFEKLVFQIVYHNSSILKLTDGTSINVRSKEIRINDLTAIYSLARLQIETFLNLSYIFFIESKHSIKLRAVVYKVHGLRKQIDLTEKHPKQFAPVVKLRKELSIELYKLRKLNQFKDLSFSKRKNLIYPKYARLLKPEEVYALINIGDLSDMHSLYSNHIHSEYISIRQLVSSLNRPINIQDRNATVITICSRITSSVISNLEKNYDPKDGTLFKDFSQKKEDY